MDKYEYAARWEYAGSGRWWPDHKGGFDTTDQARNWPSTLEGLQVKNTRVLRRPVGEWEQIEPA